MISLNALHRASSSQTDVVIPREWKSAPLVGPPLGGTHHIMIYANQNYTSESVIGFISVTDSHDLIDAKHADSRLW